MATKQLLLTAYPEINDKLPTSADYLKIEFHRMRFIQQFTTLLNDAYIGQPFLRNKIARFLKLEQYNEAKTNITILSKDAIDLLWRIYGEIKQARNCHFDQHLKNCNLKLPKAELKIANQVAQIVRPLFADVKHPTFTTNIEVMQYIKGKHFNSDLAIKNFKSRINFKLNYELNAPKNLIPVVFSCAKFKFDNIYTISSQTLHDARAYYKNLLHHDIGGDYYARVEIGVKSSYTREHKSIMGGIIHVHALISPSHYERWLKTIKPKRAALRKAGKLNHALLHLKCRRLKCKRAGQANAEFLSRELDYSLKFAMLEGVESKDYYTPKTSRLDFAQEFHTQHNKWLNDLILPFYRRSLLCRSKSFTSHAKFSRLVKQTIMDRARRKKFNTLLKMQAELATLWDYITPHPTSELPALEQAKTAKQGQHTVLQFYQKSSAYFGQLQQKFGQSFNVLKAKIFHLSKQKGRKPPD